MIILRMSNAMGRVLQGALDASPHKMAKRIFAEVESQIRYDNFSTGYEDDEEADPDANLGFFTDGDDGEYLLKDEQEAVNEYLKTYPRKGEHEQTKQAPHHA